MKKIIGVAFCVLLAGSVVFQSCNKQDPAPGPIVPPVPDTPSVPVVHLTEAQIIQKAIDKLENNTFNLSSCLRTLHGKLKPLSAEYSFYKDRNEAPLQLEPDTYFYTTKFVKGGLIADTRYIYDRNKIFYDKIFINEVGDSFLGGIFSSSPTNLDTNPNEMLSVDTINATHFQNLPKLFSFKTDSTSFVKRYIKRLIIGNPSQIQYYFNKDSLVLSHVSTNSWVFADVGDTIAVQNDYIHFKVIAAVLKK